MNVYLLEGSHWIESKRLAPSGSTPMRAIETDAGSKAGIGARAADPILAYEHTA